MAIINPAASPVTGIPGSYIRVERYEVGRTANGPQELHVTVAAYASPTVRSSGGPPFARQPHVFPQGEDGDVFDSISVPEVYAMVMALPEYAGCTSDEPTAP